MELNLQVVQMIRNLADLQLLQLPAVCNNQRRLRPKLNPIPVAIL